MEQNDYQSPSPMHDEAYDDDRAIDEESSPRHLSYPDPQDSANESVSSHDYEYQTEPYNDHDEQDQGDGQENQGDISPHQMYPHPMDQPGSSVSLPYYPSPNRTNSPKALQPASPLHDIDEYSFLRGLLFGKARRVNIPNHPFSNGHFCELTGILHCTFDGSFEDGLFKTDSGNEYSRKRFSGSVYEGCFEGHFSGEVRVDDDDTLCLTGWFAGYLDGKFVDKLNNESNKAINSNSDFLTCHEPSTVYLLPHPLLTISTYSSVSIVANGRLWIDQLDLSKEAIIYRIGLKRDDCKFEINCEFESINGIPVAGSRSLEFRGTVYGSFDGIFSGSVSKHYKNGRDICCISGSFGGMLTNCRFEGIFTDSMDQASPIAITQANDQLSTFDNQFSHQVNDQPSDDLLEDNPSETSLPCDSPAVTATASAPIAVNYQASQCNLLRLAELSAASGNDANDTNRTAPSTQSDDQPSDDLLEDNPSGTSLTHESPTAATVTAAQTGVNDQESQSNLLRFAESIAASGNEANVVNCPDQPTKGDEKPRRRSARFSGKASKCTSNDIKEEDDNDDEEEEASSLPVKKTRVKPSRSHTVEQPGTSGQQQQQPAIQDPIDEASSPPNKCVTTVSLKCLQSTCGIMVVEKEFASHLKRHSIGPYRCVFNLHCGESFHSPDKLALHYHEAHRHTVNWTCEECSKEYSCSNSLHKHYYDFHRLGTFACSFPGCTTVGETYIDVYKHYTRTHKQIKCPDCNFKTHYESRLKLHQKGNHCNEWSIRMAKMEFDCSNSK